MDYLLIYIDMEILLMLLLMLSIKISISLKGAFCEDIDEYRKKNFPLHIPNRHMPWVC